MKITKRNRIKRKYSKKRTKTRHSRKRMFSKKRRKRVFSKKKGGTGTKRGPDGNQKNPTTEKSTTEDPTKLSFYNADWDDLWTNFFTKYSRKYNINNWDVFSSNPNLTIAFIERFSGKNWDWGTITKNPNMTMDIIKANPSKKWNYNAIYAKPEIATGDEITDEDLDEVQNTIDFLYSKYKKIWTKSAIEKPVNPCLYNLASNPKLTLDFIKSKDINRNHLIPLCSNPNLDGSWIDYFINEFELNWMYKIDWEEVSKHPNIKFDYIRDTNEVKDANGKKKYKWDKSSLSLNPNITLELFKELFPEPTKNMVANMLSVISMADINSYISSYNGLIPDYVWNALSKNPNITREFVERNSRNKWNIEELSANGIFDMQYVLKNPTIIGKKWNFKGLSRNPNLTLEFVDFLMEKKPKKTQFHWESIGKNEFNYDREQNTGRRRQQEFVHNEVFEASIRYYLHPERIEKILKEHPGLQANELDKFLYGDEDDL